MDALVNGAEAFIQVFRTAADVFVGFTTGIIPIVVVFLTAVNALVKFIGEERVEGFAKWASQEGWAYMPVRYTLLPFVAVFMLKIGRAHVRTPVTRGSRMPSSA